MKADGPVVARTKFVESPAVIVGSVFSVDSSLESELRKVVPDYKRKELRQILSSMNGGSYMTQEIRQNSGVLDPLRYLMHLYDLKIVGYRDIRDTSGSYSRLWYRK